MSKSLCRYGLRWGAFCVYNSIAGLWDALVLRCYNSADAQHADVQHSNTKLIVTGLKFVKLAQMMRPYKFTQQRM